MRTALPSSRTGATPRPRRKSCRGIRRTLGVAPNQAAALPLPRLALAMSGLDRSTPRGRRDAALISLGFALGARRSELVALDLEDLEDDGEGLVVRITRSKTDAEGRGAVLYVPLATELFGVCAVRATRQWRQDLGEEAGPLFRSIRKGGAIGGGSASGPWTGSFGMPARESKARSASARTACEPASSRPWPARGGPNSRSWSRPATRAPPWCGAMRGPSTPSGQARCTEPGDRTEQAALWSGA